jgi:glycosyltransferase involved in cell wall biosynthesis
MEVARAHSLLPNESRGIVVHNGIPPPNVPAMKPNNIRNVGFIGRLEHQKDPLLFLEVLDRLPDYEATIVGGGPLEREVREELRRRDLPDVRMLGRLSHSETLNILSCLGVVVMTSRWEGLPILPLEAMWCGIPVVATNVGGLGEIIENEKSGLLVDSRSPDHLARGVVRVTEDEKLRRYVVQNARERVQALFSEERMCREIRRTYQQLIYL